MRSVLLGAAISCCLIGGVAAEPIGRWWSGFGQGDLEYGIKNDSRGSDQIYVACTERQTYVSFSVGGRNPRAGEYIYFTVGADELEVMADEDGRFSTSSHVDYANFQKFWQLLRAGSHARVRFQQGGSTSFRLDGAAKTLPPKPCETDFER